MPHAERVVRWPEYVAVARAAEEVGFDSIWINDHLLFAGEDGDETGPLEAWTLMAALAAVTRRVHLGPLVACTAFHAPAMLAKLAATVDEVSGRRLVLGLGAGWNRREFGAFGFPFDHRVSRFEESFAIIRRLLDGERVTLAGRFARVDDAVLLPRPARRPPLMIGSNGPRMLSIALPHVQIWNTWFDKYGNRAEGFGPLNDRISEAARAAGREPADIARSACVLVVLDRAAGERPIPREYPPLEGEPRQIARALHDLAEAGADEAILVVSPINERSVRTLGEALALLDGPSRQGTGS
jgi:probable F420-dependent oxidoreductase